MAIQVTFKPSTRMTDAVEVYANEACVGYLNSYAVSPEEIAWFPDDRVYNVKFQFRNEDTFIEVVNALRKYKNEKGIKYLSIWSHNNGYSALLDAELLAKAGFKHLPDKHPASMYLE